MTEPTTQVLDVDAIGVEEGFNPRGAFDETALAELEASVRENGVVSALTVRSDGNGSFVLVAGERRLRAAKRAGLKQVPVVVRDGSGALAAAVAENLIRADLDPIETARGLRRLAEAEKLGTHKQLAARIGKSANYVSERLRLLQLPERAQEAIAAGKVPVAAEKHLRKVAAVSPRVAECVCELAQRDEVDGRDLVERFGEVLAGVEQAEFTDPPTFVEVGHGGASILDLVSDQERAEALIERQEAASPDRFYGRGSIRFAEADLDAARAAGCLLEFETGSGDWLHSQAWICDGEFAVDLAERVVERAEKEAAKRAKEQAERAGAEVPDAGEGADPAEVDRRRRAKEREDAKQAAGIARGFNLALGANLVNRRGAKTRKAHSLARAKAIALIFLRDNESLAGAGLRLVLPQLQEVEVKRLKSGESREKVTYSGSVECAEYLRNRVQEAKSADEVLELLADALLAAEFADEAAVARSNRVGWWNGAAGDAIALLAADAKAVKPRRSRKRG